MRFQVTPPPTPSWDRHQDQEARAELDTRGEWQDVTEVLQNRDTGDECDKETR